MCSRLVTKAMRRMMSRVLPRGHRHIYFSSRKARQQWRRRKRLRETRRAEQSHGKLLVG